MPRPRVAAGLVATTTAIVLAGCSGTNFGTPDPVTDEAEKVRDLWAVFFVGAVLVVALIWGLVGVALVRFRRGSDEVPGQKPYNLPLEVAYTVIPILIVAGLFAMSWVTEEEVTSTDGQPSVVVDVVGFQWQWRFSYPDEDVTIVGTPDTGPPELVVPVDELVRFRLESQDVNHAFWVPQFLSKRDLIPGIVNEMDVTPNRVGTYVGRCAEFCGLDHWRMGFSVRVVERAEYDDWLEEQRR